MGSKGSFNGLSGSAPLDIGVGMMYELSLADSGPRHRLRGALDFDYVSGIKPLYRLGLEWLKGFGDKFEIAVRAGFRGLNDAGLPLAVGVGISFDKLSLDYSFVGFGELGTTHRVGLIFKLKGIPGRNDMKTESKSDDMEEKADETTPVDDATPVVDDDAAPVDDATTVPADDATTVPADDATTPADDAAPAADDAAPAADDASAIDDFNKELEKENQ